MLAYLTIFLRFSTLYFTVALTTARDAWLHLKSNEGASQMILLKDIYKLPRRVATMFASSKTRNVDIREVRRQYRGEVDEGAWDAFVVIGQGGPVLKHQPRNFRY